MRNYCKKLTPASTVDIVKGASTQQKTALRLFLVDPQGFPDTVSLHSTYRDKLLTPLPPRQALNKKAAESGFFVDPQGFEPRLF